MATISPTHIGRGTPAQLPAQRFDQAGPPIDLRERQTNADGRQVEHGIDAFEPAFGPIPGAVIGHDLDRILGHDDIMSERGQVGIGLAFPAQIAVGGRGGEHLEGDDHVVADASLEIVGGANQHVGHRGAKVGESDADTGNRRPKGRLGK